jgi:RHS repeat-associated protein
LRTDLNKGIEGITYNHLNLPVEISFGSNKITYLYSADGTKVKKTVVESGSATTTDYLGGYQYKNAVRQFFPTAEGYVKATVSGTTYNYNYIYNYTDHLGNVRLSYTKVGSNPVILEENDYYPFGLKHQGYNAELYTVNSGSLVGLLKPFNNYKYNGKELQDELGLNMYDYGARNYDPALGRWMNIDPLAEVSRRWSPYNYAYDNPVINVDPDGMLSENFLNDIWNKSGTGKTTWTNNNGLFNGSNGATANSDEPADSGYSPLTSDTFNKYVKEKYKVADNQLGDFAGKLFENAFIKFGELNFEDEANFEGVSGRSTLSRPDAYSDGMHFNLMKLRSYRYSKSVWWEVKARNKNVTLDKQIKGFIDSIADEFQYTATKTGAAFLCLVTTSNSNVSPDVYIYAESRGVNIQHWQAQYKMVEGTMHVDFGYKNSPVTPPVYEFKTPVKL